MGIFTKKVKCDACGRKKAARKEQSSKIMGNYLCPLCLFAYQGAKDKQS